MDKARPVRAAFGVASIVTPTLGVSGCWLGFIDLTEGQGVDLTVQNGTANTVKIQVAVSASLPTDGSEFAGNSIPSVDTEVIVGGGNSTTGAIPCGNVVTVVATDSNSTSSVIQLTGDGTGTEGFDSNSIAIIRGGLFQQGIHFDCGDTITVMVTATNNQFKRDADGFIELDDFGNPTIQYNVGSAEVRATGP